MKKAKNIEMSHYTLSNKAEEDIANIYDYTASNYSDEQAQAYLFSIHETLTMLTKSPDAGSSADTIRAGYRQFPIHNHMLFYKVNSNGIHVIRVLHQQMQYVMHLTN